jgi:CRP/FNR family transcriptional regulator, cyclic AMP receptor protein
MISPELIRSVRLFEGLDQATQETLRRQIKLKEFQKKETVFHRGTPGAALYMMFTGRLQVISATDEGKEVGINFISPGDVFGEIALIDGEPRSASIIAVENSVVGILGRDHALWLFRNNPLIADRIQKKLCATIRQEINHRANLGGLKAYTRIYSIVFGGITTKPNEQPALENLPSQQSIASMANVSRETVSRALHALIKQGIIGKESRRLIIKKPQVLVKLAKGELALEQITPAHGHASGRRKAG